MKLIKFLLWVAVTICMAYFITDFKIGDRTIKQRLDVFIRSEEGLKIRQDVTDWVNHNVSPSAKPSVAPPAVPPAKQEDVQLTHSDESALTKIIKDAPLNKDDKDKIKQFLDE
ncbi:hypothetical protein K1X76_03955 [bacterium]|nr:hypothetical protein [bacterium]